MITQEQAEKIIASNYLRDAVELLGGTIQYQEVLDSTGKSAKRIIITYNEEQKAYLITICSGEFVLLLLLQFKFMLDQVIVKCLTL